MIVPNGKTDVTTYFVLRDSTNHAPKTDVTITDIDLYYVEELAAISAKADATALAAADSAHSDNKAFHIGQGLYRIDWADAAFDGGIGKKVQLIVVCAGVDTTFLEVELSPAVNVKAISDDETAAVNLESACDNYSATRGLSGTALPAAAADAAGGLPISDAGGLDIDTKLANTNEVTAARMGALTDLINGGRLDLLIDAILEDTGTTLDALIKDVPTVAEFNARSLVAADYVVVGDTIAGVTTVGSVTTKTGYELAATGADLILKSSTFIQAIVAALNELATYGLTALNTLLVTTGIKTATTAAPADMALNSTVAKDATVSKPGTAQTITAPADMALNSTVAKEATLVTVAGYLDTEIAAILADTNELQTDWVNGGRLDLILDAASAPTAAAVADAVWDEAIAGHLGAGTTGNALNAAGSAGDPWATPIPGAYGAGTAGKILGDNINAPIATVDTVVDAIKVVVDNIHDTDLPAVKTETAAILVDTGTTLDGKLNTIDDFLDTEVAAILADTNELQTDLVNGGRLDLLIDAIKAKTDNLPALPAAQGDIPTTAQIKTAIEAVGSHLALILEDTGTTLDGKLNTIDDFLDTEVAAILADTNELQTDLVNGGRLDLLIDAIKAKTDNLPTDPADQSAVEAAITAATSPLATAVALDAVDNYVDTEVAAIKAKTDLIPAAPAAVGDIPTTAQIKTALEVAGGHLAEILTDTGTTIPGLLGGFKKNTAFTNFEFVMVLASDHVTPATGKTITATRSIDGAAFAACANAASEVASGVYKINLAAADLNGDLVTFKFSAALCDDRLITIRTMP